jgi:hypothetical protein
MRTVLALPILLVACSGSKPNVPVTVQRAEMKAAVEPAPPVSTRNGPVVAQLQFRDHVLVIRAGSGELRYDVQSRAGVLLASSLSRQELARQFPGVSDQLGDSTAVKLDASLHRDAGESRR